MSASPRRSPTAQVENAEEERVTPANALFIYEDATAPLSSHCPTPPHLGAEKLPPVSMRNVDVREKTGNEKDVAVVVQKEQGQAPLEPQASSSLPLSGSSSPPLLSTLCSSRSFRFEAASSGVSAAATETITPAMSTRYRFSDVPSSHPAPLSTGTSIYTPLPTRVHAPAIALNLKPLNIVSPSPVHRQRPPLHPQQQQPIPQQAPPAAQIQMASVPSAATLMESQKKLPPPLPQNYYVNCHNERGIMMMRNPSDLAPNYIPPAAASSAPAPRILPPPLPASHTQHAQHVMEVLEEGTGEGEGEAHGELQTDLISPSLQAWQQRLQRSQASAAPAPSSSSALPSISSPTVDAAENNSVNYIAEYYERYILKPKQMKRKGWKWGLAVGSALLLLILAYILLGTYLSNFTAIHASPINLKLGLAAHTLVGVGMLLYAGLVAYYKGPYFHHLLFLHELLLILLTLANLCWSNLYIMSDLFQLHSNQGVICGLWICWIAWAIMYVLFCVALYHLPNAHYHPLLALIKLCIVRRVLQDLRILRGMQSELEAQLQMHVEVQEKGKDKDENTQSQADASTAPPPQAGAHAPSLPSQVVEDGAATVPAATAAAAADGQQENDAAASSVHAGMRRTRPSSCSHLPIEPADSTILPSARIDTAKRRRRSMSIEQQISARRRNKMAEDGNGTITPAPSTQTIPSSSRRSSNQNRPGSAPSSPRAATPMLERPSSVQQLGAYTARRRSGEHGRDFAAPESETSRTSNLNRGSYKPRPQERMRDRKRRMSERASRKNNREDGEKKNKRSNKVEDKEEEKNNKPAFETIVF